MSHAVIAQSQEPAASNPQARPPPGKTILVRRNDIPTVFSSTRETDVRTALTRGLKEYLEQLQADFGDGRRLIFEKVFEVWAEFEDKIVYPSAVVYTNSDGAYDAASFTPTLAQKDPLPDGRYLMQHADYTIQLYVEAWMNDPDQRMAMVAMLEDAFTVVDWQYGIRLELPHYYNVRGTYELAMSRYEDSEAEAIRGVRKAILTVNARAPLLRLHSFPGARPTFELEVLDGVE